MTIRPLPPPPADLPCVAHAVPPEGLVIEGVQLVPILGLQGPVQRAAL